MKKNQSTFKKGINLGLTFGAVLIFLSLIGFTVVVGRILFDARSLEPVEYGLVLVLCGLVLGIVAAGEKNLSDDSWKTLLSSTGFAGLATGVLMAVYTACMQLLVNADSDPRDYLVMLSPDMLETYLFESSMVVAMI